MTGELFVQICLGIISIIGALVCAYVIPFIKSKINATELDKVVSFVSFAVRCAEQIFPVEQWQEKKDYVMKEVMDFIDEKLNITLSYEQLDTIVEGIVNEIKHGNDLPVYIPKEEVKKENVKSTFEEDSFF